MDDFAIKPAGNIRESWFVMCCEEARARFGSCGPLVASALKVPLGWSYFENRNYYSFRLLPNRTYFQRTLQSTAQSRSQRGCRVVGETNSHQLICVCEGLTNVPAHRMRKRPSRKAPVSCSHSHSNTNEIREKRWWRRKRDDQWWSHIGQPNRLFCLYDGASDSGRRSSVLLPCAFSWLLTFKLQPYWLRDGCRCPMIWWSLRRPS